MRTLIVYAHPEPQSFNGALKDVGVETLRAAGHEVRVSDLFAMDWKAGLDAADFPLRRNDDFLDLSVEQAHATERASTPADVKAEQDKVEWAELIVFQFPLWWFGMPGILKGWVDRTMARGFAYAAGRKYDTGMFKGKRAMLSLTTGTAASLYEPGGIDGDIMHILWPIHNGIFKYLGFEVLPPHVVYMPGRLAPAARQAQLDSWRAHLQDIETLPPLFFHPLSDYDSEQRLKPGVVAKSGFQWNPHAGQTHDDACADSHTSSSTHKG